MAKSVDGIGYFEREDSGGWLNRTRVEVYKTTAPNLTATLALNMIERWGSVAGIPDDEDSQGRQKLRLQKPMELVQRACDTAALAIKEFRLRNWLLDLPAPRMIEEKKDEKEKPEVVVY